jgi:hypothetical protein
VWASVCTVDRLSLGDGPSAVLTREGLRLHKSLCAYADRLTMCGGPLADDKMGLGRNYVFWGVCIVDYLVFEPR